MLIILYLQQNQPDRMSCLKMTNKQFAKIPLFWNVRQINGQKAFKIICESAKVLHFSNMTHGSTPLLQKKFIYVKEGQIYVYRKKYNNDSQKSLIRSYKALEFCGFQDYPLFWNQSIQIQIQVKTTIITLPMGLIHRVFRRVIPMNYLQSKAEYLKRLTIFKSVELEKIFRIACLSHKYRAQKGQIITEQRSTLKYLIVIFSGVFQLRSQFLQQPIICGQNQILFAKQIQQEINCCFFRIECISEGDLIAIPKQQYLNITDIRYKLHQQEETIPKEEVEEQIKTEKRQKNIGIQRKTMYAKAFQRPKTQSKDLIQNSFNNTVYTNFERIKCHTMTSQHSVNGFASKSRAYSRGENELSKYLKRKDKIQTNNFLKYVESRAPQIIINPSKQFALVKPFYKSKSLYVKNMKRKMKKSANEKYKPSLQSMLLSRSINFDN